MGIIKTTLESKVLADLVTPRAAKENTRPELTAVTVSSVIALLKNIPRNGGYARIAKTVGLKKVTKSQVRRIHRMMKARIAELTPAEEII